MSSIFFKNIKGVVWAGRKPAKRPVKKNSEKF